MKISRRELWEKAKGYCLLCGCKVSLQFMDRCHIVPRVQGGPDSADNLFCGCLRCNRAQGERTPEEAGLTLYSLRTISQAPRYGKEFVPESLDAFMVLRRMWRALSKKYMRAFNQHGAAQGEGYPTPDLEMLQSQCEHYKARRDYYAKEMGANWAKVYPGLDAVVLPQLSGIGRGLMSQMFGLVDYSRGIGSIKNYIGIAPIYDGHWPKRKKGQKCKHVLEGKSLAAKKVAKQIRQANALSKNGPTRTYQLLEARKQYDIETKGFSKGQAEFEASAYVAGQLLIKLVKCCLDGLPFHQPTWLGCPKLGWCQEIIDEYQLIWALPVVREDDST